MTDKRNLTIEAAARQAEIEAQALETRAAKLRLYALRVRAGQNVTTQVTNVGVYVRVVADGRDMSRLVEQAR